MRVLQEREFRRVGGTQIKKCDVRILTATNRDLHQQVRESGFREDLFYRINVVQVVLPAVARTHRGYPAADRLLHSQICRQERGCIAFGLEAADEL